MRKRPCQAPRSVVRPQLEEKYPSQESSQGSQLICLAAKGVWAKSRATQTCEKLENKTTKKHGGNVIICMTHLFFRWTVGARLGIKIPSLVSWESGKVVYVRVV